MIKIGVLGAGGRMGQWVTRLIQTEFREKATLAGEVGRQQMEAGDFSALMGSDVVIDFASPTACEAFAKSCQAAAASVPALVVGSTGWKLDQRRVLEALVEKTPVLMSSNFSTGVLALMEILKTASPFLEKLGYSPIIVETHHKHKKDSPSGTALSLQRSIAPAGPGNVQTHSIRAGEIIGDHEVTFYGPGDHLTLGHFAQDRSIFARGSIEVALWLARQRTVADRTKGLTGIEAFFKGFIGN